MGASAAKTMHLVFVAADFPRHSAALAAWRGKLAATNSDYTANPLPSGETAVDGGAWWLARMHRQA